MPFIINEDKALKNMLTGITVSDSGNPTRPVGVFYGQPDKEIRSQNYPYITIDLIDIAEDTSRAHRGHVKLTYKPEGVANTNKIVDYPIPVDLYYQVSTWSRQPRHDRQLMAALFSYGRLPFRFGTLAVTEDDTIRRIDMMGFSKRDMVEGGKRLFSNVYNIRVSAEIFQSELSQMYQVLHEPTITYTEQLTTFIITP